MHVKKTRDEEKESRRSKGEGKGGEEGGWARIEKSGVEKIRIQIRMPGTVHSGFSSGYPKLHFVQVLVIRFLGDFFFFFFLFCFLRAQKALCQTPIRNSIHSKP